MDSKPYINKRYQFMRLTRIKLKSTFFVMSSSIS